jgi:hypothetical protein
MEYFSEFLSVGLDTHAVAGAKEALVAEAQERAGGVGKYYLHRNKLHRNKEIIIYLWSTLKRERRKRLEGIGNYFLQRNTREIIFHIGIIIYLRKDLRAFEWKEFLCPPFPPPLPPSLPLPPARPPPPLPPGLPSSWVRTLTGW